MDILIAVDVQKGFTKGIKTKSDETKVNNIVTLVNSNVFDSIVYTKFKNKGGSLYEEHFNWKEMCDEDSIKLHEGFKKEGIILEKGGYSCNSKDLIDALKKANKGRKPKKVYICGLDTNACVLAVAIQLWDLGIRPIVLEKYCLSTSGEQYHNSGVDCLIKTISPNNIIFGKVDEKKDLED